MIELTSLKCPECGSSLDVPKDRDYVFCQFCGTKILLNNSNEQIVRHVDEAAIKQAENARIAEQNRIELEKMKLKSDNLKRKTGLVLLGLTILYMIIIFVLSKFDVIDSSNVMLLEELGVIMLICQLMVVTGPNKK